MATIDQLDISIYNMYAIRTKMIEETNQQYRLSEASSIPPQTRVLDNFPKMTELDMLLGIVPMATPWALFLPPKKFRFLRRSPFAFFRIAPSLGSLEKQEEDTQRVHATACKDPNEESEKEAILGCLDQVAKINDWLGFIIGRIGQFLQG